jgi:hypothetical protein
VTRLLTLAEYGAGASIALATAIPIHALVHPGWDLVLAMLLGSAIGMALHMLLGFPLGALIGMFQVMLPGSLIGMYGGMLFAMRDAMQPASWTQTTVVAIVFGVLVVAGVQLYDRALRTDAGGAGG